MKNNLSIAQEAARRSQLENKLASLMLSFHDIDLPFVSLHFDSKAPVPDSDATADAGWNGSKGFIKQ